MMIRRSLDQSCGRTSGIRTRLSGTLALILFAASLLFAESGFKFEIPKGWVDLTKGVPEAYVKAVPEGLASGIRSGKFAAGAVDFRGHSDGFIQNMNAVVVPGSLAIDLAFLDLAASNLSLEFLKQSLVFDVLEKQIVKIGRVDAARLVADISGRQGRWREMVYFIPGRGESAVLTYSAGFESFESYRPVFEAAAAGTLGADDKRWDIVGGVRRVIAAAFRGAIEGGLPALVFGILFVLVEVLRHSRTKTDAKKMDTKRLRFQDSSGVIGNGPGRKAWPYIVELYATLIVLVGFAIFLYGTMALFAFSTAWAQGYGNVLGWSSVPTAVAAMVGGLPLYLWGAALRNRSRKMRVVDARQLLRDDPRAPIIYLRSFRDDERTDAARSLGSNVDGVSVVLGSAVGAHVTQEERLAKALSRFGPFIAIGDPKEDLPDLGAARLYLSDEWPEVVSGLMFKALLIVFRPGAGEGLWWEVARAKRLVASERIVFWFPPASKSDDDRKKLYDDFCQRLQPIVPCPIPPWQVGARFLYFAPHWSAAQLLRPRLSLRRENLAGTIEPIVGAARDALSREMAGPVGSEGTLDGQSKANSTA